MDTFYINNFLSPEDLELLDDRYIDKISIDKIEFFDKDGVWKGENTSIQNYLDPTCSIFKKIHKQITALTQCENNTIDTLLVLNAKKPYDVHNDFIAKKNRIPLSDPSISSPTFTCIIPLVTGDWHTIIFDQSATYSDFYLYKEQNKKLNDCIPEDQWQKYLKHCHKEDREYLTIKKIFSWQAGNLFAFDRRFFHSSANFTLPKKGIVLFLSKKVEV